MQPIEVARLDRPFEFVIGQVFIRDADELVRDWSADITRRRPSMTVIRHLISSSVRRRPPRRD
jgi:hypothetical protein